MEAAAAAAATQPAASQPLPFLGDDIFVLIAAELDARMLGRLGCAAGVTKLGRERRAVRECGGDTRR